MSGFFNIGKQDLLARVIPDTAGVWIVGVNADYAFNAGQTEYALLEEFVILPAQELTSVTFTDGFLNADDPQWIAAGAGAPVGTNLNLDGVIVFFSDGVDATLLAHVSGPSVGLPQTLTGVNITARINPQGLLRL